MNKSLSYGNRIQIYGICAMRLMVLVSTSLLLIGRAHLSLVDRNMLEFLTTLRSLTWDTVFLLALLPPLMFQSVHLFLIAVVCFVPFFIVSLFPSSIYSLLLVDLGSIYIFLFISIFYLLIWFFSTDSAICFNSWNHWN